MCWSMGTMTRSGVGGGARRWRKPCATCPDLLRGAELSKEDRKLLAEIEAEGTAP